MVFLVTKKKAPCFISCYHFYSHIKMRKIIALCVLSGLMACTTPQMLLNEQLASQSIPMDVKGRQGLMLKQELSFGPYLSDRVRRGWSQTRDWDAYLVRLQDAQDKYSFTLFDTTTEVRAAYTVSASRHIKGIDLPLGQLLGESVHPALRELASFSMQAEDIFAASLYNNQWQEAWHMMILNPDDIRKNGRYAGLLMSEQQETIELIPVRRLQTGKTIGTEIVGFEFVRQGRTLASVEVLNKGRVWIDHSLEAGERLVLASASATLLLQQDLSLPED